MSGQDEPNPALWLATRTGKMELSCPLGTMPYASRKKNFPPKPYTKSFIDQVFSVKIAGYWPCSCFASLWTSQKNNLGNIYPAILTSHLVNNPYILYTPPSPHLSQHQINGIKSLKSIFCYGNGFCSSNSLFNHFSLTCQFFVTLAICKLAGISEKILRFWWQFSKCPLKKPSKFLYFMQDGHFDALQSWNGLDLTPAT